MLRPVPFTSILDRSPAPNTSKLFAKKKKKKKRKTVVTTRLCWRGLSVCFVAAFVVSVRPFALVDRGLYIADQHDAVCGMTTWNVLEQPVYMRSVRLLLRRKQAFFALPFTLEYRHLTMLQSFVLYYSPHFVRNTNTIPRPRRWLSRSYPWFRFLFWRCWSLRTMSCLSFSAWENHCVLHN